MTESPQASFDGYARLRDTQKLVEHTFHSDVPLLGPLISRFRQCWNNVSTTWYVRPLIDQQNRFNASTVDHLTAQNDRVDHLQAQLGDVQARLHDQERLLADAATGLSEHHAQIEELRGRLGEHHGQIEELWGRLREHHGQIEELWGRQRDHDAWLIEMDREHSGYVRDLAEVTLQLVQLNRQLQDLSQGSPAASAGRSPAGSAGQVIHPSSPPLPESNTPDSRAPHGVAGAEHAE